MGPDWGREYNQGKKRENDTRSQYSAAKYIFWREGVLRAIVCQDSPGRARRAQRATPDIYT